MWNRTSFYILTPVLLPLFLIYVFYNIPNGFGYGLWALPLMVFVAFIFLRVFFVKIIDIKKLLKSVAIRKRYRLVVLLYCCVVVLSGFLDVYINGFKLLNPSTYAEFHGYGRSIRHISILCWTLVPIALFFIKSPMVKRLVILYAIIFPILIVDRNRLLTSFFVLFICIASLENQEVRLTLGKVVRRMALIFIPLAFFAILGAYRSGTEAFFIPSSGSLLQEGYFPLRPYFYDLSWPIQQIILYVTSPLFNFATVFYFDFLNPDLLLSQMSPFGRDMYAAYPYTHIMVARFNVGTEFFPWLLYAGILIVFPVVFFMIFSFFCALKLFYVYPNIFTCLIFLRVAYDVLFMGFSSQFYLLLTPSFILLMTFLWFLSVFLNLSKSSVVPRGYPC